MQAAMRLALSGGFAAMTVRQIAREAQVAAGQLHHHFASIGELKSQVFIRLIREMLDMPLVPEDASWRERLFSMIGSEDGRLEPYIRLWREGRAGRQRSADQSGLPADDEYVACRDRRHHRPGPRQRRISIGGACGGYRGALSPRCAASTGFMRWRHRPG